MRAPTPSPIFSPPRNQLTPGSAGFQPALQPFPRLFVSLVTSLESSLTGSSQRKSLNFPGDKTKEKPASRCPRPTASSSPLPRRHLLSPTPIVFNDLQHAFPVNPFVSHSCKKHRGVGVPPPRSPRKQAFQTRPQPPITTMSFIVDMVDFAPAATYFQCLLPLVSS
jgi:hypothetical protein